MENDVQKKSEERKRPGVERVYKNDQIAIYWEPSLCIHVGNCFRGLPKVFDPQARPWVAVDADTADRIARVIETRPTVHCIMSGRMAVRRNLPLPRRLSTPVLTARCSYAAL